MIGQNVTLVRVKPQQRSGREVFTTKGVITDAMTDDHGNVTSIRIQGVRVETGTARDSWFAVGPDALNGSLCTEQTATLDACGHAVTYGCDCDTIAAEADDQDDCEHDSYPSVCIECNTGAAV